MPAIQKKGSRSSVWVKGHSLACQAPPSRVETRVTATAKKETGYDKPTGIRGVTGLVVDPVSTPRPCGQIYEANVRFTKRVNRAFLFAAVFLWMIPFETSLSMMDVA